MADLAGMRSRAAPGEQHVFRGAGVRGARGRTQIARAIEGDPARPVPRERRCDRGEQAGLVADQRGERARAVLGLRQQVERERRRVSLS